MILKRFVFLMFVLALFVLGIVLGLLYILTFPIIFGLEFVFFGTSKSPMFLSNLSDCMEWTLNTVGKKLGIDVEDDRIFLD